MPPRPKKGGAPPAATKRGEAAPPVERRWIVVAAGMVALLAATLYLFTLAPTVGLVDSGELIAAAHGFGVAHPPGFPLWVTLAHLATRVPIGSVAARVNASSALFAALAAALLVAAFREAAAKSDGGRGAAAPPALALLPAALAGLLLAASRPLRAWATVAEVYALHTLLVAGILYFVLSWRRDPANDRPLLAGAALFGLSLGVHHVSSLLLLPALALLAGAAAGPAFFAGVRLLRAAGVAAASAALVYLQLPLAARRDAGLDWGDPDTFERFFAHVSGRQYRSFLAPTAATVRAELADWTATVVSAFGPLVLPLGFVLALYGFFVLRRRDRPLGRALLLGIAANALFALVYTIAEDKDAYALPAVVLLALAAGFGARELLAGGRGRRLAPALLALPLLALAHDFRALDRSGDRLAADYVEDALHTVGPGALLLTGDWQLYSPLHYFREVERRHRDVVAIDVQLLRRSWYFDFLRRDAPRLLGAAAGEVDSYLDDLRRWERDPAEFERNAALLARIQERFVAMNLALVERALESGPVYLTPDLVVPQLASEPAVARRLSERHFAVPQGLLFELHDGPGFVESSPLPPGRPRRPPGGLFDASRPLDPKGVAAQKIRPVYLTMIASRGGYLAAHGRSGEAREAFAEALALDPSFEPARRALAAIPAR